jgi:hypothetical protein
MRFYNPEVASFIKIITFRELFYISKIYKSIIKQIIYLYISKKNLVLYLVWFYFVNCNLLKRYTQSKKYIWYSFVAITLTLFLTYLLRAIVHI